MAKKTNAGTAAINLLNKAGVDYELLEYEHNTVMTNGYALDSAEVLGIEPARVFKTLIVTDGTTHAVGVVPATGKLNLKRMAKALGVKHVQMMEPAAAERLTGYITGGISPFGQKKQLPTIIDTSAQQFDRIAVSGGKRSYTILIAPAEVAALTRGSFADISAEH